ncbi:MAG: radical SAM protein [Candidatus Nealsonbacteria bacterium]|nr:radical SAM protein [Candidatus Nealsonbacteria bacterium]
MNKKTKGKVLLVYPNCEGSGGIPNGLALLSGCLKTAGFEIKCFDTTFLNSPPLTFFYREKHGGMMKAEYKKFWGEWTPELAKQIPDLFKKTIEEFQPDLIAVNIIDVTYNFSKKLLNGINKKYGIPVVAGGPTPTLAPELFDHDDCFDIICVGEGEDALVELANSVVEHKNYSHILNLWVKNNNEIIRNKLRPLKNLDEISFQDWSIFDERHYYKPYCGTFRRTGFFELARGCPFNCTFCCTANLRKRYDGLGKFLRQRSIDKTFDEICSIKDNYKLELVFFIDDNFLGMSEERFNYFCEQYKKRINLPYYIQTRAETVREDYIKKLLETNISTVAIGIENGNEEFRKKIMNRTMSNAVLEKAFNIVHKYKIRSTANFIIGMPYEDEKTFYDSIRLIQKIKPSSYSINYFQPYQGTKMREIAIELGFIPKDHIINESNTCLDMPQFKRERIIHCYENFKKYIENEIPMPKE